ncbi:MAG: molybdopterin-dependent oxidoreductase [Deltaproteobacteria bacterium]|nr:molybdopterin-dependent oxidoreductase [Deltaproteobacteria bacterium]
MTNFDRLSLGKIPGPETGIEIRKSICAICDPLTQCGLDLYVKDGKVIKVEGSKEHPYSVGTLCSKGAAQRQYVYSEDRLKTPLKRIGPRGSGKFEPISWDEALETIASKFNQIKNQHGPESVVFFAGYTKYFRPYLKRLAHSFGSPNYMSESSTCYQAMAMAQKLTFGTPGGPDVKNTKCLLIWSANPFYTNPGKARAIIEAKERGMKLIVVDPRQTPTTALADIHLPVKPGADGALALAMANVIIREKLYDQDFVANHSYGFEDFREYVRAFTPEKGEELTGVPADRIISAARMFAAEKPSAIMPSASPVVHHTNGVQNYRAIFALVGLTGNYDVHGGNFVVRPSFIHIPGMIPTREHEFTQSRPWEEMAPRIGADKFPVWIDMVDEEAQAMHLPFQIRSADPYPLKGLIGFGMNHRMWPDPNGLLESLEKLDLFVNVDIFMTDTCKYADIVLPACTSVERSELRCYPMGYIIFTQPAIAPLYDSRADTDIIYELAARFGLDDPLLHAGYEASVGWILEPSGISVADLEKHPGGMFVPNPVRPPEKKYLKQGFKTPSGKMEFKSRVLEKYEGKPGFEALPVYTPPKYSKELTPELAHEYPFILNTGARLPMYVHTRTFRLSWTNSLRPNHPAADINPYDAARLGLQQDETIRISTSRDAIVVKANLTQMVQPGVIHMYHGDATADVNTLFEGDYLDPLSGYPGFKSALCKVEKVQGKKFNHE